MPIRGYKFTQLGSVAPSSGEQFTRGVTPADGVQRITAVHAGSEQTAGKGSLAWVHTDAGGDFSYTCTLTSQGAASSQAHAGIYWGTSRVNPDDPIPQADPVSLDAAVSLSVVRANGSARLEARSAAVGTPHTTESAVVSAPGAPIRLRLTRAGNLFSAYTRTNGAWALLHAATVPVQSAAHVGVFASGATAGDNANAEFTGIDLRSVSEFPALTPPVWLVLQPGERVIALDLKLTRPTRGSTERQRIHRQFSGFNNGRGDGYVDDNNRGTFALLEVTANGYSLLSAATQTWRGGLVRISAASKRWIDYKLTERDS